MATVMDDLQAGDYTYAVSDGGSVPVPGGSVVPGIVQGRPRRTFAAGCAVNPLDHYFVMPDISDLFENIKLGKYCVLCSRRQSGKTSAALILRDKLIKETDIFPVWLEGLEEAATRWDTAQMWAYFCACLRMSCPSLFGRVSTCTGSEAGPSLQFRDLFRKSNLATKVVLIMDEADSLRYLPAPCVEDFFHTVRTIKQLPHEYNLKSFLLIGVETVKDLLEGRYNNRVAQGEEYKPSWIPSPLSPFPHDISPVSAGSFTVEDVVSLMQQYNADQVAPWGSVFKDVEEIAASIISQTRGHKGLVGTCLAFLVREKALDAKSWRELSDTYVLGNHIFGQATYSRIMQYFREEASASAGYALLVSFLEQGEQVYVIDQLHKLRLLLAEGVLAVKKQEGSHLVLDISSPLLRTAIFRKCAFVDQKVDCPPNPNAVDRMWLILQTIKTLDGKVMCRPECLNASSEYIHQFLFMSRIKNVLSQAYPQVHYVVLAEAKEVEVPGSRRSQMRLDTLLRDGLTLERMGFELVINASEAKAELHEEHARIYSEQHSAQVFMINFTNGPGGVCITPKSDDVYSMLVEFDDAKRFAYVTVKDVHGKVREHTVDLVKWTGRISFEELV